MTDRQTSGGLDAMAVLQSNHPTARPRPDPRQDAMRRILLSFRRKVHRYFPEAVFDELVVHGCTKDELAEHLARQFDDAMAWSNYGEKWIVQCRQSARGRDLTKPREFYSYFHHSNFEPVRTKQSIGFKAYPDRPSALDRRRPAKGTT